MKLPTASRSGTQKTIKKIIWGYRARLQLLSLAKIESTAISDLIFAPNSKKTAL
jgi:hypothetical protein